MCVWRVYECVRVNDRHAPSLQHHYGMYREGSHYYVSHDFGKSMFTFLSVCAYVRRQFERPVTLLS